MRTILLAVLALPAAITLAPAPQEPAEPEAAPWHGTVTPAADDAVEIEIWPDAWSGEWLLLEVAPHGARVDEGAVIARFEPRALTEAIEGAERSLEAARLEHRLATGRARLEEQADRQRLEQATAALARAEESFDAYLREQLPMRHEQAALGDLNSVHGIQDQEAELAQLEAMYKADELTDATEELVLMRARRNLEQSRAYLDLARRQRRLTADLDWAHEQAERTEAIERQRAELERQRASAELDGAARRARLQRSEHEVARSERELARLREDTRFLELRAPRAGILLHGGLRDYEPGGAPQRHERGGRAATRRALFTVAGGERWEVILELGEAERARARGETPVNVAWPGLDGSVHGGAMTMESFPTPRSAGADESRYLARVSRLGRLEGAAPGMRVEVRRAP